MRKTKPEPVEDRLLAFWKMAVENANDAVIVCDYDERREDAFSMVYVNPAFETQTGYTFAEAVGQPPGLLYGPETDAEAVARTIGVLVAGLPARVELLKYRKDGTPFWTEMNMRPMLGEHGELVGYVGIQRDIDERRKAMAKLELLSSAMDQANDGIAIFELHAQRWTISYVNEMFLRLTGYRREDVVGRTSDFLVGPRTDTGTLHHMRLLLASGEVARTELEFYRADGAPFWAEMNGRPLKDPGGKVTETIIVYRDVTEKHALQERLTYEAAHDSLTGILNRRAFVQSLDEAIALARRHDQTHALIFFDLDGFKSVNDRYGHEAGDRLLVGLIGELAVKLRRGDAFGRMGGDEFGVLLFNCAQEQARRIAGTLLETVANFAALWNGHRLRVGASFGLVEVDAQTPDAAEAMRRADDACYEAKRGGKNRVCVA